MLTATDWALLERHTEVENAHRLADTLATLTEDCIFEDMALGTRHNGHAEAGAYYEMWWNGIAPTVEIEQVHEVADRPTVVAETVWRGQHVGTFLDVAPTGRLVRFPLVIVADLRDGLLARERLYWDRGTVLAQLREVSAAVGGTA